MPPKYHSLRLMFWCSVKLKHCLYLPTKSWEEHIIHVQSVPQRLIENSLFVKTKKCEFDGSTVFFLGYVVAKGSLQMGPSKVLAVTSWPVPDSHKLFQRFLGFANFYRHLIQNYSSVATPRCRSAVTQQPRPPSGPSNSGSTQRPFSKLPDTDRQFVVGAGAEAVLSQRSASDRKVHPFAFFSQHLSTAERNYNVSNRELLAVNFGGMETLVGGREGTVYSLD